DELDGIEERIATAAPGDERQRLARIRKAAVRLHRRLMGLRSSFRRLEGDGEGLSPALRLATARLLQRLDGLDHDVVAMRERAHLLQEEVAMRIADETNRNLGVLAVVTTLFLPPTLVTGIYGMNVKGVPLTEGEDGFLGVVAILAIALLLTVWLLRQLK